jgi:hypothetical protein
MAMSTGLSPHGEWHGHRIGVIPSGEHGEERLQISHRARHRADDADEREGTETRGLMTGRRNAARSGLEAADTGEVRRDANRAAAVAPDPPTRQTRGNRRRFSAARSARRPRRIPGIHRPAVQRIVGLVAHQHLGYVGGADDDRTGLLQPMDDNGVPCGHHAGAERTAGFAAQARDLDGALHGDGQPAERATRRPVRCGLVLRARFRDGLVGPQVDERADRRIEGRDAIEVGLDQIGCGKVARVHEAHEHARGSGKGD